MKKIFLLMVMIAMLLSAGGCTKSAPKCESEEAKKLVLELAPGLLLKKFTAYFAGQSAWMYNSRSSLGQAMNQSGAKAQAEEALANMNTGIEMIRTTEFKKDIGTYVCAAQVVLTNKKDASKKVKIDAEYKVELTDGGKNHVVTLSLGDFKE